jgi:uncharacterized hydrophobic protein (TIGR00271 family)
VITRKILHYFKLEAELDDFDKIHESILKDVAFKGTNLWILMFAIIVASVGLNMNSTAVIIGAMLISPLMGPINGIGYGIATYNFVLFRLSVKNFSFAVLASLVASTLYFLVSPVSTAHSELLARTTPTIYDVIIAFFGGLAGIVAISSKLKGNVIPGVAIATALMPPLCTAGYGLATGQIEFFLGALYLFTINTVFIALASVAISQILKFPIRTIVDTAQKKKVNSWISIIIVLIFFPSVYFGYGLVQREKLSENAGRYISHVSMFEGNYLLDSRIEPHKRKITLVYGGMNLTDLQKMEIRSLAENYNLHDAKIEIKQGFSFESFNEKNTDILMLKEEYSKLSVAIKQKDSIIEKLKEKSSYSDMITEEIKSIYPFLNECIYSETFERADSTGESLSKPLVVVKQGKTKLSSNDKVKISNWMKTRMKDDEVKVVFE